MARIPGADLLLLVLNIGVYFAMGQSTIGDSCNDDQNLDKYCCDASFALVNSIQSDVQSIKAQIAHLEKRVESQGRYRLYRAQSRYVNYSIQEINVHMQRQNTYANDQIRRLSGFPCPTGFNRTVNGHSKCYAFLSQSAEWDTAQQRCRRLHPDSHLAVINGTLEQQIVTNIVESRGCVGFRDNKRFMVGFEFYWIGGQVQDISDCRSAYVWKPDNRTSLPLGYINWFPGEPNCADNIEKCLATRTDGRWNDLACDWSLCSVCEVAS